ncbi:MAG: sugar kinase [Xanthomonadaceae bacterium]|nr:sugar kinase [Xanthomonadaceae bacterium]MDP2185291.1 sugar kinase [Xanthomonadales bacterium]MDZ4115830.1 sugar kinase [Xanthomonadaceae bacterium]MDZ4378659.1 sugar kinase [Xanthomonadaceae bacterium]
MDNADRKIILVTRRTRLQELVTRYNTVEQARFQAEHLGMDFGDFLAEDRTYQAAVAEAEAMLGQHGRLQRLDRGFLPNFLFPPDATVVVLGQDGLVANTLKYLRDHQPVLGINPDIARWDGALLPFGVADLAAVLPDVWKGRRPIREVSMARARLTDGQELLAVNDFFIGVRGHTSARYEIGLGERQERQSSSGVIVSTGLGSTGWLRSVLTGATGVAGGRCAKEVNHLRQKGLPWDARELVFSVREPYPSRWSQAELVFGRIGSDHPLRIRSLMPDGGLIFSDGIEADGIEFRSGLEVSIGLASQRGHLLN